MKFNLSLKYSHLWVIDDLKQRYSISSNEEIVKRYVNSALQLRVTRAFLAFFSL